jgi:hypothetical protein
MAVSVPVTMTMTTTVVPAAAVSAAVVSVPIAMSMTAAVSVPMTHGNPWPARIERSAGRMRVTWYRCEQAHRCESNRNYRTADAHEVISLVSKSAGSILG